MKNKLIPEDFNISDQNTKSNLFTDAFSRIFMTVGLTIIFCISCFILTATAQNDGRRLSSKTDSVEISTYEQPASPEGIQTTIVDGGFEASTGNPITNTNWISASTNFGQPICSVVVCGNGGGVSVPRNGTFFTWLGGIGLAETGSVQQSLTIPTGGRPVLKYWLKISTVTAPFNATMTVKIDGNVIQTITEPATAQTAYSLVSVAIPPGYGDNAVHAIRFEYINPAGSSTSSFLVDDISLDQNAIADNGFEASVAGTPITNPSWTGTSTSFTNPFCSVTLCGTGGGLSPARNGTFWVWFGGTSAAETASVQQSLVIPQNSRPVLKFWLRNGSVVTPFAARLRIFVDGALIRTIFEKTVADTAYSQISTALPTSVANGAAHIIRLEFTKPATSAAVSMVVDDITLESSAAPTDFDGDRKADVSISRVNGGNREWWYRRSSTAAVPAFVFGLPTDRITPGDYTGDGKTDIAVFRPSNGNWIILRSEDSTFFAFPFGGNADIAAPADYDGDGKTDAAVFRPAIATWFILNSGVEGSNIQAFGSSTDSPVPADYDGDGKADLAIFRQNGANKEWWYQRSTNNAVFATVFGTTGDRAVQGDYTGDGKTDIAFWRPSNGNWFVLRSEDLSFFSFPFGATGDVPAPGDYDGDGKIDSAVFRSGITTWFLNQSTAGSGIIGFGTSTDTPVASAFIP
jgi:FG-GAP-like repeat